MTKFQRRSGSCRSFSEDAACLWARSARGRYKASLNGIFLESFMALNIINFADMARKEKDGVSWDVRRVSSP